MKTKTINSTNNVLPMAICLGLLTGLVEGILLFGLRQTGLLNWRLYNRAIWYETLWIAPVVDFVLFLLVGLFLVLVKRVFVKLQIRKIAWFIFVLLMVFDWAFAIIYGRISLGAILLLSIGITIQLYYFVIRSEIAFSKFTVVSTPWLIGVTIVLFVTIQGGNVLMEKTKTTSLPDAPSGSPNVIVIVVDTLRADHLTSYGYARDTSPFIASAAQRGVLFENAISASSWTQPSHASMLTGRYTYEHQAETKPLDNRFETIGEAMQTSGYRTGAFSGNTEFFTRRQGFGRGFLHFEDNYHSIADYGLNTLYGFIFDRFVLRGALNYEGTPGRRFASDINRSVLQWINKDDTHPFFLFINYFDVHDPYEPPQPYRNKFTTVLNPGGLINGYVERYHPDLSPEQLQSEIDAYDGSISYVDDQVKALLSDLEQRGMLDNTIVIITSDHGESLGEHGLLQHSASLYRQEIHVPLIVLGPGIPAGKQIDTPISTTALPSTILSLIKARSNPFPGPSLTELMFVDTAPAIWPEPISEVAQFVGAAEQNPTTHGEMKSVVGNDKQYILHEKFGDELYSWRIDPEEIKDLAKDPEQGTVLDAFKQYLKGLIGEPIFKKP